MRALSFTSLALLLGGCSALIDPDESLLGGEPGADGGVDTGSPDAPDRDAPDTCLTPCDDGIDCTEDACTDGECTNAPDDGVCGPAMRCQPSVGCVAAMCRADPECDDSLF